MQAASREHWRQYWTTGGAIDLSGNDDPRAAELERRIVLSQYVMAVHDAGSLPPQETGLAVNSWFGKFHMEMYWWHAAHWALWGRPEILEKSLSHLTELMPPGREMAKREGCQGVKWSKMTDPSGVESPSGIGPVLVWQQPHPIYLAELVWRAHRDRATLERYKEIVFETADYMATFVDYDRERKQYVLGPGVASAEEKHTDYAHNLNPTMELGYWKWALETAQDWRVRLGMPRDEKWQDVIDHLAPLTIRNGVYPTLEFPIEDRAAPMATWLYGILPGRGIDLDAMRNTLHAVPPSDGNQTWGTAMVAMCAARMKEPDRADRFARWEKRKELVPRLWIHDPPPDANADVHAGQRRLAGGSGHDGRRLGWQHGARPGLSAQLESALRRLAADAVTIPSRSRNGSGCDDFVDYCDTKPHRDVTSTAPLFGGSAS